MNRTIDQALADLRKLFAENNIEAVGVDSRILLGGLLDIDATATILRGDDLLTDRQELLVEDAARRRIGGEPVYRILGWREFYSIRLELSEDTLEPRPDTETLVDALLVHVRRIIEVKGVAEILDLGTGTGAIGLALLGNAAQTKVTATDIAAGALAAANANAARNGLAERFKTVQSCWFEELQGSFDVIASNPPYIASAELARLAPEVRLHDPSLALDGGADGLDAYRAIAAGAGAFLADNGVVGVEIGHDQKHSVISLFESSGFLTIESHADLAGNDRVLIFSKAAHKQI